MRYEVRRPSDGKLLGTLTTLQQPQDGMLRITALSPGSLRKFADPSAPLTLAAITLRVPLIRVLYRGIEVPTLELLDGKVSHLSHIQGYRRI